MIECKNRKGKSYFIYRSLSSSSTGYVLPKIYNFQFLPANCTSKLHPQDLGIIKYLKQYYRKPLVKTVMICLDHGDSIDVLQPTNLIMMIPSKYFQKTTKTVSLLRHFLNQVDANSIKNAKSDHFIPREISGT